MPDLLSLLSNSSQLRRFFQYVGLVPMILQYIQLAELTKEDGPRKRAFVLAGVHAMVDELIRRTFVPEDMRDDLDKVAGELIDTAVASYNKAGFFEKKKKKDAPDHSMDRTKK